MNESRRLPPTRRAFERGATLSLGFAIAGRGVSALRVPGCLEQRRRAQE